VHSDPEHLHAFQASLLAEGVPLAWAIDVPVDHPAFAAVQRLFMSGRFAGETSHTQKMTIPRIAAGLLSTCSKKESR
jgi:hypothetical protein